MRRSTISSTAAETSVCAGRWGALTSPLLQQVDRRVFRWQSMMVQRRLVAGATRTSPSAAGLDSGCVYGLKMAIRALALSAGRSAVFFRPAGPRSSFPPTGPGEISASNRLYDRHIWTQKMQPTKLMIVDVGSREMHSHQEKRWPILLLPQSWPCSVGRDSTVAGRR